MNSFLLAVGGFLVVVLCALFAVPHFVDWNTHRSAFEAQATRLLGREVRVGGEVNLRLLPVPYISFENVRVADVTGRFDKPLVKLEAYTVWLSVPPLLQGRIEAREMELVRPRFQFAVDDQGRGNWQGLGGGDPDFPFAPKAVALRSAQIRDGIISLRGSGGQVLLAASKLDGELSAGALRGPYRFRGTVAQGDEQRELKISTGRISEQDGLNFKATLHGAADTATYVLEGTLQERAGELALEGGLTGRLPFPGKGGKDGAPNVLDLKATIEANTSRLRIAALALTFETAGKPQLVTGSADASWSEALSLSAKLQARWLDLDHLAGEGEPVAPWQAFRQAASFVERILPRETKTRLEVVIEKANLAHALVEDIDLRLSRDDGPMRLERFEVGLPGQAKLEMTGLVLSQQNGETGFSGDAALRGASLARLLAWASPSWTQSAPDVESHFSVRSNLAIDQSAMILRDVSGEIAGSTFRANLSQSFENQRIFDLHFESDRLDLRDMGNAQLKFEDLRQVLAAGDTQASGDEANSLQQFLSRRDASFDVRIGQLVLSERTVNDLSAKLKLHKGHLSISSLELASSDGLELDIKGDVKGFDTSPKGQLRYVAEARKAGALKEMISFFGLEASDLVGPRVIEFLAPGRVAGVLEFGARGQGSIDLSIDGAAGGGRAMAQVRFDGSFDDIDGGTVDATASLDHEDGDVLLTKFAPSIRTQSATERERRSGGRDGDPQPGLISIRASGTPRDGMTSAASFSAGGVQASYNGLITVSGELTSLDGRLTLSAADARDALALAGLGALRGQLTGPLGFRSDISLKNKKLTLARTRLTADGTSLSGGGTIESDGSGYHISLQSETDRASFAQLLGVLVESPAEPTVIRNAQSMVSALANVDDGANREWLSDRPFDLEPLQGITGTWRMKLAHLEITQGMTVLDAAMLFRFAPDKIGLEDFEATALGGRLSGKGALARARAGASFTLEARLADGNLAALGTRQDGLPFAEGRANVEIAVSGRGLSPRGLAAVIGGGGTVSLFSGTFRASSPLAVDETVRAVIEAKDELEEGKLETLLREKLSEGGYSFERLTTDFTIQDGALRAPPIGLTGDRANLSINTFLNVAKLALDSKWELTPITNGSAALPRVTAVYSGRLVELASIEPRIDAAALGRELTVRKMEGDVKRLEELRRIERGPATQDQSAVDPAPRLDPATDFAASSERSRISKPIDGIDVGELPNLGSAGSVEDEQRAVNGTISGSVVDQSSTEPSLSDWQSVAVPTRSTRKQVAPKRIVPDPQISRSIQRKALEEERKQRRARRARRQRRRNPFIER